MHNGKPSFEWTPGEPIEDVLEDEEGGTLEIAAHMDDVQEYDQTVNEEMDDDHELDNQVPLIEAENDDQLPIEDNNEDHDINDNVNDNNREGLDAVIEDHIVSDKDDIIDPSEEEDQEDSDDHHDQEVDDDDKDMTVVANINDDPEPVNQYISNRPRRT